MKRVIYCLIVVALVAGLVLGCGPSPAAKEVTLKAISFLPVDHPVNDGAHIFVDKVNELGKGLIQIDFFGGPEVIPGFDQVEAAKNGNMDMVFSVTAYYGPMLRSIDVMHLTEHKPWEERENGLYDFIAELHKEINVFYIGRWSTNQPFYLFTTEPSERPADLAGRKMRTGGLYDDFLKALGAVALTIEMPDVYTALERGLVDGFGWPMQGPTINGWTDSTKYCIDHPFYEQNNTTVINLDLWNSLAKEQQDVLMQAAIEAEKDMWDVHEKQNEEARGRHLAAGLEFIKYSAADADYYTDLAYASSWQYVKETVDPVTFTKLEQLLRK
ncbi:TRAP transporter substrate-binding protein DctP [Chloroflexota bacterium]